MCAAGSFTATNPIAFITILRPLELHAPCYHTASAAVRIILRAG